VEITAKVYSAVLASKSGPPKKHLALRNVGRPARPSKKES